MTTFTLADLSLFPATPAQMLESRKRSAESWAKGLTLEQYVLRDAIMDQHEHAAGGKLTTWVLAPRNDPETLDFMCSVETFRRPAIVAMTPQQGQSQQALGVIGYGIASVFTPPAKRRRGYAQHMMRLLHWVLAPRSMLPVTFPAAWGEPPHATLGDAQFSVLYSDVGGAFYRTCGPDESGVNGWLVRGASSTSWRLSPCDLVEPRVDGEPAGRWEWLTEDAVKVVMPHEAERMRRDMVRAAPSDNRTLFSFLPHQGVCAFTIQRTMVFPDPASATPALPLETWGAVLHPPGDARSTEDARAGAESEPAFAIWTLDGVREPPRALVVLRLRTTRATFSAVLRMLVQAAQEADAATVEIWDLPETLQTPAHEHGWTTAERDDHLSAFKWYGPEREDEVKWMFNEKFCWC
ncbi:hypothetical protein B0H21DRAFT_749572 [Amylocystis lapponica]|nr:hypothetical protein B0H21DRAFT_749572 [Amylocystis lapponica]